MAFSARGLLVGSVLALAGPLQAQVPAMAPAPAARFSISPEYAFSVHSFDWWHGHGLRLYLARVELRPARAVSPWLATGLFDCSTCVGSGWASFAGVRYDLLGGASRGRVQPYAVAALGGVVRSGRESTWVPSAGLGLRLRHAGDFAPRLEVRFERYDNQSYAMLSLGVNLLFAHRGPSATSQP